DLRPFAADRRHANAGRSNQVVVDDQVDRPRVYSSRDFGRQKVFEPNPGMKKLRLMPRCNDGPTEVKTSVRLGAKSRYIDRLTPRSLTQHRGKSRSLLKLSNVVAIFEEEGRQIAKRRLDQRSAVRFGGAETA